jgi:hypothetical protein
MDAAEKNSVSVYAEDCEHQGKETVFICAIREP